MTKEEFIANVQRSYARFGPPELLVIYKDKNERTMYNEFDINYKLIGGGNISVLIARLEMLPK